MKKLIKICFLIIFIINLKPIISNASLKKAIEYYKDEDFYNAVIEFSQLQNTRQKSEIRDKIDIFLANSLFSLELYSYSLVVLLDVIERGEKGVYYIPALEKSLYLSGYLTSSDLPLRLAKLNPSVYPYILSDKISYIVGEYLAQNEKFTEALQILSLVPEQSSYYSEAQYIMGIINYERGNIKKGIEILRDLVEIQGFQDNVYLEDQTYLGLARIFYSLGKFEKADEVYNAISKNSNEWSVSLAESTWALFLSGNFNKALGNLHALYSPYFQDKLLHELNVIEATIYYDLCMYNLSRESIENFHKTYDSVVTELERIINYYSTNKPELGQRLKSEKIHEYFSRVVAKFLEENNRIASERSYLYELYKQKRIMDKSPLFFRESELAKKIDGYIVSEILSKEKKLGSLALELLKELIVDLKNYSIEVDLVKFEILRKEKQALEETLMEEDFSSQVSNKLKQYKEFKGAKIFLKQNQYYWPFDGEFWADELSDYIFSFDTACKKI